MKLKLFSIIFLNIVSLILIAQPSIYTQLCALNKEWHSIQPTGELLKHRQFSSDQEIITYHLQQVEKHLTQKNNEHLAKEIQQRRQAGLDVLRAYWKRARYPENNKFNYRSPFFIDDNNTACAVGYLMQGTGNEDLANYISETQNTAYVKEMVGDRIFEWASDYGFTINELAWIQPNYGPCGNRSAYIKSWKKPSCGKSDGSIEINERGIVSYEWKHGASGLKLDNLSAGIYEISGLLMDITPCPFQLEVFLNNEQSADLVRKIIKRQSCEAEDGIAEVVVSNANGSYNIEWSNGETSATISNLKAGYYSVAVTDANNCKAFSSANITEVNGISFREIISGTSCNANTGSINLEYIRGGSENGTYNIQWMDGDTSETRNNLATGDYTVVISDDMGCSIEKTINVPDDCNKKINCTDDYFEVNNQHGAYIFPLLNDEIPKEWTITSTKLSQPNYGTIYSQNRGIYYKGNETYTGVDSFTYTICTRYGYCDSAMIYLNVVDKPVVTLNYHSKEILQIYSGENIGMYMRGAKYYNISPDSGILLFSNGHFVASPAETTSYTLKGTNADGQTDTFNFTIEVILPNFELDYFDIQMHKHIDNDLVIITGDWMDFNFRIFDANGNDVFYELPFDPFSSNQPFTIDVSNFNDGLHYLNIQSPFSSSKNVMIQTIID